MGYLGIRGRGHTRTFIESSIWGGRRLLHYFGIGLGWRRRPPVWQACSQTGQSCWVGCFPIFSYWDRGRGWRCGREPLAPAGAESRCHQLVPLTGRREWEHRVGKMGNGGVCRMGHWGPHVFQDVRGHWEGQISKVFQRYLKVWASFRRNGRFGRYWGSHFSKMSGGAGSVKFQG